MIEFDLIIMGIFGGAIGDLFGVIWDGLVWLGETLGGFFTWLGGLIWDAMVFIGNILWEVAKWIGELLWEVIKWIGELLWTLLTALFDFLMVFFQFIYDLVAGLLYFLYQIGVVAVKVFTLFLELALLIWSFIVGLLTTLASLQYSPSGSGGNGYSDMIGKLFTAAEPLQLNVVAYILLAIIWVFTAIQTIKILSGLRVGGD